VTQRIDRFQTKRWNGCKEEESLFLFKLLKTQKISFMSFEGQGLM